MKLRKDYLKELKSLKKVKEDLIQKQKIKESEILEIKKLIKLGEVELLEIQDRSKKLEAQQHSIKKVEEFNALSQEMSSVERERATREQRLSDLMDKLAQEEDLLNSLKETWETTLESSGRIQQEILHKLHEINAEGRGLQEQRGNLVGKADPEVLSIYDRLLQNKRDRVIVPIENRVCTGCHLVVTAQDENLVRKGERLVFCEHCSRVHYWPEEPVQSEQEEGKTVRRRRRSSSAV